VVKSRVHDDFPGLIRGLEERRNSCEDPLLLAALIAEKVICICIERVNTSDSILNELEDSMGQHEFLHRPGGNPLELDFDTATRKINTQRRKLVLDTTRLRGVSFALKLISDESKKITMEESLKSTDSGTTTCLPVAPNEFYMMDEMSSYLMNACENTLLRVEYEIKRAETLLAVVRGPSLLHQIRKIMC
jgi:hypothetical protein